MDRAELPAATPCSTHYVHQPGVARLRRWGLLDAGRGDRLPAGAADDASTSGRSRSAARRRPRTAPPTPTPRGVPCSTRSWWRRPSAAGAEVRERFSVDEILIDDGRVTGIRGRAAGGATVTERARIVIGADGLHSLVARAVGAPGHRRPPGRTCAYYTYWDGLQLATAPSSTRATAAWSSPAPPTTARPWSSSSGRAHEFHRGPGRRRGQLPRGRRARARPRRAPAGRRARRALPRHRRPAELLPPAVRPGLGAGGRRRLPQGPDHRAGHQRRLPRRRAARRGDRRRLQPAAGPSRTRWPSYERPARRGRPADVRVHPPARGLEPPRAGDAGALRRPARRTRSRPTASSASSPARCRSPSSSRRRTSAASSAAPTPHATARPRSRLPEEVAPRSAKPPGKGPS